MKNKVKADVSTIATRAASRLWDAVQCTFFLSHDLVDLITACDCDIKAAGAAFGAAWSEFGTGVDGGLTTGILTEACLLACLDQNETRQFINATGVVSRQQAHKKGKEVFEGKKTKKNKTRVVNFKTIEADLKSLTKGSLTKEQAMALAKLISAAV